MELLKHMQPAKSSGVGAIGVAKDCVSITYPLTGEDLRLPWEMPKFALALG